MGVGRQPRPVQSETRAREHDVLRALPLCLFRCALATMFFLATGTVVLAQERPASASEQEEISIKAGEILKFKVHLDKAPTSSEGRIMFVTSPLFNAQSSTTIYGGGEFCALTEPQKLDYDCEVRTSKNDVVGALHAEIETVFIQYPDRTSTPRNWKRIRFLIQGAPPVPVVAEDIEVTLVPSQTQLLRSEGIKLQRRISNLKAAVVKLEESKAGADSLANLLRSRVRDEVVALEGTQRDFDKLITEKQKPVSTVFFGDLHSSYERALVQIDDFSHRAGLAVLAFRLVSQDVQQDARPEYPLLAQATFRAFEQNELAYNTVADAQTLTFNLDVSSIPTGATVSYRRRGDQFQQASRPTDSTIKALPFAIWTIRFEKDGFRTVDREHDPFREPNHVVTVQLPKVK